MRVRFLRPAEEEYLEALRYYTSQSVDLGVAFLDDLDHAVELLAAHPQIGAPYDGDTRRLLLRRFHHSLVYDLRPDEVVILAVAHHSQRPDSWRKHL